MGERSAELLEYYREMVRRGLQPGTIDKRMSVLTRCENAAGHPLIECNVIELRTWLDDHKLVAKTRYSYISHLSSFWTWALTEERATSNPTLRLTRPILRQGLPRPVASEDLAFLIAEAPNAMMAAMVTLAAYAGLRCMEIAGLDAGDVMSHLQPPAIVVSHGKGGKSRVIPVGVPVVAALRVHGVPAYGPVFRDEEGHAFKPWQVSQMLRAHMHNCGVLASGHQLRHTYGTELYRRSNDILLTGELLGHASPVTTAGYAAWSKDKAAAVVATLFT